LEANQKTGITPAFYTLSILNFDAVISYLQFWSVTMSTLHKDMLIGLLFIVGMWSFISGEFIFSTILFASAAIYSNMVRRTS
jgi:hypothetical protein